MCYSFLSTVLCLTDISEEKRVTQVKRFIWKYSSISAHSKNSLQKELGIADEKGGRHCEFMSTPIGEQKLKLMYINGLNRISGSVPEAPLI